MRATVGECLDIDIAVLARRGGWQPNARIEGIWNWTWRNGQVSTIGWTSSADALILHYSAVDAQAQATVRTEHIDVLCESDRLGRPRVWLRCPGCGARVRIVYLRMHQGASRFLCRRCHGLGYASQRVHKSDLEIAWDRLMRLRDRPASAGSLAEFERLSDKWDSAMSTIQGFLSRRSATNQDRACPRPAWQAIQAGPPSSESRACCSWRLAAQAPPRSPEDHAGVHQTSAARVDAAGFGPRGLLCTVSRSATARACWPC
jgi:hypothetical protein